MVIIINSKHRNKSPLIFYGEKSLLVGLDQE
jgi:hypothetical protein